MDEETIFNNALEKGSPQERAAYLDEACGHDGALRRRVESLLASHDEAGDFLECPAIDPAATPARPRRPPGCGAILLAVAAIVGLGVYALSRLAQKPDDAGRLIDSPALRCADAVGTVTRTGSANGSRRCPDAASRG